MEQARQPLCRWLALCACVAILCGALLATASAAGGVADYVINLQSTLRPADPSSVPELPGLEHYRLYTTPFEKDGETWHALRLGFFASERHARQALQALRSLYPRARVTKASPGEAEIAAQAASPPEVPEPIMPGAAASGDTAAIPEVLTLDEAADFLRVDLPVLEDMARRQEVPGRRIGVYWRFSRSALRAWLAGAEVGTAELLSAAPEVSEYVDQASVASPVEAQQGEPLSPGAMSRITAAGTATAAADDAPEATSEEEPIGEAPEERTAEDVFLRGQRVLLAPGEVVLDAGLFYSESDNQELAVVNGGIGLATVETETFTGFLLGRYGLFEETEIFASTTYRDQDSDVLVGNQKVDGSSRSEMGDVRVGLRRTVLREDVGIPDVILTLEGRIPTDDDHSSYGVGGGVALVKSIDPVVLFANANYLHTFSQDFDDVTRLEAEDRVAATLGYAYALNDTITLSTSLSGLFLSESDFDNVTLREQELFSLNFGLTSWLAKGLYIEPTVSYGLNGPGDSFVIGVTVPYTFSP
jgi:excisionase family DNA binding protein